MMATADSRINKRICAVISTASRVWFIEGPLFPSKVSSR